MNKFILILFLIPCLGVAQLHNFSNKGLTCTTCHSCEIPTKENPCLISCPREKININSLSADDGPDIIEMNIYANEESKFKPIMFTHKLHAEMSGISGGCGVCHHYNPPAKIVSCISCHETERKRENIFRPDLKGAYHRMCMDCHKQWGNDNSCNYCHEQGETFKKQSVHPEIEKPSRIVYSTAFEEDSLVTFYHNEHEGIFAQECSSCHSNQGCVQCHHTEDIIIQSTALHERCSSCHNTDDNCEKCHSQNVMPAFNHFKRTKWKASKLHENVKCVKCHNSKESFAGLKTNCEYCHKSWNSGNFNHKITGIQLDENHVENECMDCHSEGKYSQVNCFACHDEDISYPAKLPGKKIK